ncbi:hypothetical protein [Rhizobium leguminosarum]|uniref:hypothetical protein n=1 Tax=Rhizobium leguminosarum TaxID=384 RepID=UPI000567FB34|nr:hypothetical protein [Rhizobium leguminosarum]
MFFVDYSRSGIALALAFEPAAPHCLINDQPLGDTEQLITVSYPCGARLCCRQRQEIFMWSWHGQFGDEMHEAPKIKPR